MVLSHSPPPHPIRIIASRIQRRKGIHESFPFSSLRNGPLCPILGELIESIFEEFVDDAGYAPGFGIIILEFEDCILLRLFGCMGLVLLGDFCSIVGGFFGMLAAYSCQVNRSGRLCFIAFSRGWSLCIGSTKDIYSQ